MGNYVSTEGACCRVGTNGSLGVAAGLFIAGYALSKLPGNKQAARWITPTPEYQKVYRYYSYGASFKDLRNLVNYEETPGDGVTHVVLNCVLDKRLDLCPPELMDLVRFYLLVTTLYTDVLEISSSFCKRLAPILQTCMQELQECPWRKTLAEITEVVKHSAENGTPLRCN